MIVGLLAGPMEVAESEDGEMYRELMGAFVVMGFNKEETAGWWGGGGGGVKGWNGWNGWLVEWLKWVSGEIGRKG